MYKPVPQHSGTASAKESTRVIKSSLRSKSKRGDKPNGDMVESVADPAKNLNGGTHGAGFDPSKVSNIDGVDQPGSLRRNLSRLRSADYKDSVPSSLGYSESEDNCVRFSDRPDESPRRLISWSIDMIPFPGEEGANSSPSQQDDFGATTERSSSRSNPVETRLGKLLKLIDPFIIFLIVVNSVMLGIGTLDFIEKNKTAHRAFELCDNIFLCIFTAEVCLSLIHFARLDRMHLDPNSPRPYIPTFPPQTPREKRSRSKARPWLIFDIIIIVLSWVFNNASIFRAFRVFRAFRLISKVKSLKNLMRALIYVTPKMNALIFITVVLLLVFGVMVTLLFKDLSPDLQYNYFGRIDLSLLTLFQMMTFDNWHEPAREVMETYPASSLLFVFWVFISGFVVMNLIIAIICESLINLDQTGMKAITGQELQDEFSIHLRESRSSQHNEMVNVRLIQIENALNQLLDEEVHILEELERLRKEKAS